MPGEAERVAPITARIEVNSARAATKSASPSAVNAMSAAETIAPAAPVQDAVGRPAGFARSRFRDPERYQIIEEHGRGGLGRVLRTRDLDLGREIAIKESFSRGEQSEARFLREALITARLQHPGIVPVYEAGRWRDGKPFYAMKLVAGRSLRDLLLERTTVDQRIGLLHHVIAVADAMAYAHGCNIIHRDLKPANVIIGEFGETIVIDWGLAKDLSDTENAVAPDGTVAASGDNELTHTGAVLGTPCYMPPEQERGEQVDQRADVFAIGAMLWDLCSTQRVPPTSLRQRHRLLRGSGIDPDLAVIIDKALDPDPRRRYPDAGALAADLKAFKSGARIAARRYSALAILGHWMRRHRALTASLTAALFLAASGSLAYVRNIAIERDRAEDSSNRLILKHAELLLRGDPSAAFDLLATYRGADVHRQAMLRAQARGLGLSHLRVRPHTLPVLFAHALEDGALVTLGADGTVAKTSPDGVSRVIGGGIPSPYAFDYAVRQHLLAYACGVASICLLDVETEAPRPSPGDGSPVTPLALAFSPGGDLLAAITAEGDVTVWSVSDARAATPRYRARIQGARSMTFVDENTLAVQALEHVGVIHLDAQPPAQPVELRIAATTKLDSSTQHHLIALGTDRGALVIIDSRSNQIMRQETVCKGRVNTVLVVTARSSIAYACQDGDAGYWDLQQEKLTVVAHVEAGVANLATGADGRYLLVGASNGKLVAYDFTTRMLSWYLGHAMRLTALLASSAEFPYIASGDSAGTVRTWSPPQPTTRVAIQTAAPMIKAMLLPNKGPLIAVGSTNTLPWYSRNGMSGALEGHDPSRLTTAVSPRRSQVAMWGDDNQIEVWSFEPDTSNYKLELDHGAVYTAAFTSDGNRIISGSRDGTLTEWSNDGKTHRDLASIHEPVHVIRSLPGSNTLVVVGASRTLWLVTATGITHLGKESARITQVACSYDSKSLAVGTDSGLVRLYDLSSGESSTILDADTWIDTLSFSPDSTSLAIATRTKIILHRSSAPPLEQSTQDGGWHEVELTSKYTAFSPDGTWFAAIADHGDIWFYRRRDNHWVYLSVGAARLGSGKFSEDGAWFSVADTSGRALLIDMRAKTFD